MSTRTVCATERSDASSASSAGGADAPASGAGAAAAFARGIDATEHRRPASACAISLSEDPDQKRMSRSISSALPPSAAGRNAIVSPSGRSAAFISSRPLSIVSSAKVARTR